MCACVRLCARTFLSPMFFLGQHLFAVWFVDNARSTLARAVGRVSTLISTRSVRGFVSFRWHDCVKVYQTLVARADED